MKLIFKIVVTMIVGVALGGGSALWAFGMFAKGADFPLGSGRVEADGWTGNLLIGSEASDPYTRAYVARHGLLALSREETIYFSRVNDDDGRRFNPACTYEIVGSPDLPARWWSITLYADDNYLAQNGDEAHSVSVSTLDPSLLLNVSMGPKFGERGQWLSSRNAGQYSLTLRLYNPEDIALNAPQQLDLPGVKRVNCDGVAKGGAQ